MTKIKKIKLNEITKKGKFRLSCKKLFLTYSQCDLDLKEAVSQLKEKLINYVVVSYIAAREQHKKNQDEGVEEPDEKCGVHLHIYLETSKKVNISNCERLHLEKDGKNFKGNYQSARNKENTINYILKDINCKENENLFYSKDLEHRISKIGNYEDFEDTVVYLVKKGQIHDALNLVEKEKPFYYCKNHMSLEKSFRELYLKTLGATTKFNFKDFIIPSYFQENLEKSRLYNKSLILSGDSGCGKSKFMESYLIDKLKLNPLIINNIDSIRFFRNGVHEAILFDDCSFVNCEREELIKLLDSEDCSTFSIKHSSIQIGDHIPRFITTNRDLKDLLGKHFEDKAILRRIIFVKLLDNDKLYVINNKFLNFKI